MSDTATQTGTESPVVEDGTQQPPEAAGATIEVAPPPPEPKKDEPPRTFTAEEIEAARKQERDKLYKDLETERQKREALESSVGELTKEREARIAAEEKARKEAEEAAKAKEREEMSAAERVAQIEQDMLSKLEEERAERERLAAMLEAEHRFQALDNYRRSRIEAEQNELMPELVDLISGNSEEEIEQSIAFVKDKTARILDQVQVATQQQRQQQRGVSPTGAPPAGPPEDLQNTETLTAEQIRNMTPEEYAKRRPQLLSAASGHVRDKGLYS